MFVIETEIIFGPVSPENTRGPLRSVNSVRIRAVVVRVAVPETNGRTGWVYEVVRVRATNAIIYAYKYPGLCVFV